MPSEGDSVASKLAAARTRLILDRPFLGALVLRLPMVEASGWCTTTATDLRSFYYNPGWIAGLTLAQTEFVLAHEALHCALGHFIRRGHRVQTRWDLACDFAINPLLLEEGLVPPAEAVALDLFRNMTAEEIYPCLEDDSNHETFDQHLYDQSGEGGQGGVSSSPPPDAAPETSGGGRGNGEAAEGAGADASTPGQTGAEAADRPLPPPARDHERLAQQWQRYLASAAQQAQAAGRLSGGMARLIEGRLQPKLPWRTLLAHFFFDAARTDYNYMRPSRREGEMIFPSRKSPHSDMVIALDTSGSVSDSELDQFIAEINAIKGSLPVRITLLACDSRLAEGAPWVFESWEACVFPHQVARGGGTSFRPVFSWVEQQGVRPDVLIYFTDALGMFPPQAPAYPVLWLVKGKAGVPWGSRIQLN